MTKSYVRALYCLEHKFRYRLTALIVALILQLNHLKLHPLPAFTCRQLGQRRAAQHMSRFPVHELSRARLTTDQTTDVNMLPARAHFS